MGEVIAAFGGVANVSAGAALILIITIIVRALVRGDLIPSATHDRIVAAKDDTIKSLDAALDRASEHSDAFTEHSETLIHLIASLRAVGAEDRREE